MVQHQRPKPEWFDRVIATSEFHKSHLRLNNGWRIVDTAKALSRSKGSIVEDLMLAAFIKTHSKQLERIDTMRDALVFVRAEKKRMALED